ncbi:MAG TPA: substrate-binding domain-containing protein [Solirubrobacteraceae bacterium]|jgi:ribose transport system substrate-binding protein
MRKLVKYLVPLAMVASMAIVAAPALAGANPAAHAASKKITIGYMNEIDGVPFVQIVKNNVLAAAKKAGVTVDVCNPNGDAQQAVNCAAQFKTEGVQGILNFQADAAAAARVCAAGPKVPVIAFDIVQKPCQTVFYGANNSLAGKLSGAALGVFSKKKFGCKIDAFVVMDDPAVGVVNNERMNGMIHGYESVCSGKPANLTYVNGGGATSTAIAPASSALTRLTGDHKILVVSLNDDMAIGAIKAAQSAGRLGDIYVGAQGADPTAWPYLCGKQPFKNWEADTAYFPELYGNRTVPLLLKLIHGQKVPKIVYTQHKVVTPANIKSIYPNACK